jgi:8-oxo-dGTP pyrophosphatase MutT (NUDIX family)
MTTGAPKTPSLAEIEQRLKSAAAAGSSDYALNPGMKPDPKKPLRDSAVLILLIPRDDGATVVFTERTKTLHAHAGQISFPGGGVEEGDADAADTALREAGEEIGLDRGNARVIGKLGDYVTRTGFRVTPVVAVLEKEQAWTPNPDEVAEVFEVPLAHILDKLCEESLTFEGGERRFYACTHGTHHIWGATAGMLNGLKNAIAEDASGPPPTPPSAGSRKIDQPPRAP